MASPNRPTESAGADADETTPLIQARPIAEDVVSDANTESVAGEDASVNATDGGKDDESENGPAPRRLLLIISGPLVLAFLAALDSTLIATLAEPIAVSFNGHNELSLITSSYFIATIISSPLVGRLSDIFGRAAIISIGATFFSIGNVLCALSKTIDQFIGGRALAGLGAGALGPVSTFILGDLLPLRRRGIWIGIVNSAFSIGASIGGLVGGAFYDSIGWRYAFWVQVPLAAVALLFIGLFLRLPNEPAKHDASTYVTRRTWWRRFLKVDIFGALILSLASYCIGIGVTIIPSDDDWAGLVGTMWVITGIAFAGVFFAVEWCVNLPILPLGLLRNGTVLASCSSLFFITVARMGFYFYVPIFFLVQGYSTTETGLRFLPEALAICVGSLGAGLIMRTTGRYWYLNLVVCGLFVLASGLIATTFFKGVWSWVPFVVLFLMGLAFAGVLNTTLMAFTSSVDQNDQATVTSMAYVFRTTSSALALMIAYLIYQPSVWAELRTRLKKFGPDAAKWIEPLARNYKTVAELPNEELKAAAIDAYIAALRGLWMILFGFAVAGGVIGLLAKEYKLHKRIDRREDVDEETSSG